MEAIEIRTYVPMALAVSAGVPEYGEQVYRLTAADLAKLSVEDRVVLPAVIEANRRLVLKVPAVTPEAVLDALRERIGQERDRVAGAADIQKHEELMRADRARWVREHCSDDSALILSVERGYEFDGQLAEYLLGTVRDEVGGRVYRPGADWDRIQHSLRDNPSLASHELSGRVRTAAFDLAACGCAGLAIDEDAAASIKRITAPDGRDRVHKFTGCVVELSVGTTTRYLVVGGDQ